MSTAEATQLSWHENHRGIVLEGPNWRLEYDLLLGLYNLTAPPFPGFQIRWARARVLYRKGGRLLVTGTDDGRSKTWQVQPVENAHGHGLRLAVVCDNGRRPALEFTATLYRDSPLLLLELGLHNTLAQAISVEALQPLDIDPEWGGRVSLGSPIAGLYSAGWQSWSPAGWKPVHARDVRTRLGILAAPMHDAPTMRPHLRGRLRADMVGVLTPTGKGANLLTGLLSTADQLGTLRGRFRGTRPTLTFSCATDGLSLAPEERVSSERVALLLAPRDESPLETYAQALGREMEATVQENAPRGWCSWTAFYLKMGEEDVLRQVAWLAEQQARLPVEVIQIDDGWEKAIGDWEANERFPRGMAYLAEEIRKAGFTPGLWLAPWIVNPNSRLAQTHPEWLLRDDRGRPTNAGYGWGSLCHGLDITRPEVLDWTRALISTATQSWGYAYLKLDFLYAAILPGRRHRPNLTRAQALRRGLEVIREEAGAEAFLLGCGCPLGPAIGLFDAMRIGTDVAPNWRPRYGPFTPLLRGDRAFPSAASAVRNTITQAWSHRRLWLNDPDALILRQAGSRLTEGEVRTLTTTIALSGGSWMLGDDMTTLEQERVLWAAATLPLYKGRPQVPDLLTQETPQQFVLEQNRPWGHGWIVALFNWEAHPADVVLDISALGIPRDCDCHVHEYWSREYRRVRGTVHFAQVESHGCRVFLLQPVREEPQWVGSTLYLLQGQEVTGWESSPQGITMTLDAGRTMEGSALLWLPKIKTPQLGSEGEIAARLEPAGEGLWRISLRTEKVDACRLLISSAAG